MHASGVTIDEGMQSLVLRPGVRFGFGIRRRERLRQDLLATRRRVFSSAGHAIEIQAQILLAPS